MRKIFKYIIFVIVLFNTFIFTVSAKREAPNVYKCPDLYKLMKNSSGQITTMCCKSTYTFHENICYDKVSGLTWGVANIDQTNNDEQITANTTIWYGGIFLGGCGYRVRNMVPMVLFTCTPQQVFPETTDVYIHSNPSIQTIATETIGDCAANQCTLDLIYMSKSGNLPSDWPPTKKYCFSIGEECTTEVTPFSDLTLNCPHMDKFCACDVNGENLGWYTEYYPCTNIPIPPEQTTTSPKLTCHEICIGEGKDKDGDPKTDDFEEGEQYASCCSCVCGTDSCPKDLLSSKDIMTGNVWTEVGCINATEKGIVIAVMRIFLGVVTTIALFRFVQAAFMMNTDDPEKIKEGKSIFASAITAIFAAVLMPIVLNFMGIKILGDKIGAIFDIFSR